jgi:hypothetical protein
VSGSRKVVGLGSKQAPSTEPMTPSLQGGRGLGFASHLLTSGSMSIESKAGCFCSKGESSSLPGVVVGIHMGLGALIACLFCFFLGWRHR